MATTAKRLPDAVRRALPEVTVTMDVQTNTYTANGHPAKMTNPRGRVECVRCQCLIGHGCATYFGYTVYVPTLKRRRAYCMDCVHIEFANDTPEWHEQMARMVADIRNAAKAR